MENVLVSWIGLTDLKSAETESEEAPGPVGSAVQERSFDRVVLLANSDPDTVTRFVKWLSRHTDATIEVEPVQLTSPMDFREIYEAADACVTRITENADVRLTFHLSPGTSAMTAMWLILATTRHDAELIASSLETGVYTPDFPFDISADYLPRKTAKVKSDTVTRLYEGRTPAAFDKIVHCCDEMKRVIGRAQRVAEFDVPVMILGESGTGKELFAEAIHNASPRRDGPYVAVNCGALPKDLVEAELFGHKEGAFTGANADRAGYFEQADHGTLFLDELGELPLAAQVKLLRVLQEGQLQRVGDDNTRSIDVRIISATNKNLPVEIQSGEFREDLYHRLAIGVLQLPPLRDRQQDLKELVSFRFSQLENSLRISEELVLPELSAGAWNTVRQYQWPGNIRELFNALTRAVIWSETGRISRADMENSILTMPGGHPFSPDDIPLGGDFNLDEFVKDVKRQIVARALRESRTQKAAAELLGIPSSNLRQKIRTLNIT